MIDAESIVAMGSEFRIILKYASAVNKLMSKSIRPTPLPRVNLPAPKVAT